MEEISKYLPFISAIIVCVISVLFSPHVFQLFSAYGRRKFFNNIDGVEVISFFEKHAPEYYNDFILPKVIENNFYINTGIRADIESIKKYIDFKKATGATWEHIRIAKSHLRVEEEGVKIRISKFEKIFGNIVLTIGLFLLITGVALLLFLNQFKHESIRDIILMVFVVVIPLLTGYFLAWSVNSILMAKRMEDDLKKKHN
ncbi:hypothetical protein D1J36_008305 [Riemerella anatipestifer]|uniref:hypothetical protein n=1 Tax=Riemerella anatipestifer TaxID=34085 RepID=UPI0012ADBC25|nr:hypothetical protein [Riemerella anatipestifer]USL95271.1 hypothetical protein D1J36_008305 [Riemerella anatipestifer]